MGLLSWLVPELPDVTVYVESIAAAFRGAPLRAVRLASPFLVRTHTPPLESMEGKCLLTVRRIGKRIALGFGAVRAGGLPSVDEGVECWCVIHLMIAGRLHRRELGSSLGGRSGLLGLDFDRGALVLTEAGSKRRASVHLFSSWSDALSLDRGGIEPLECSYEAFRAAVCRENHTLKRTLCDPRLLSGIGNAYSDEILFFSQLSPVMRSQSLTPDQIERLFVATRHTLRAWIVYLRQQAKSGFPEKVTAYRPEMAVHGRYRLECRQCGSRIARIVYATNETNYCPRCQTHGRVLADRALSRLLKGDFPRTIEELEVLDRTGKMP